MAAAAVPIPEWIRVLDEADEGTARIIIESQLQELKDLTNAEGADYQAARDAYEVELKRYRGIRRYDAGQDARAAAAAAESVLEAAPSPQPDLEQTASDLNDLFASTSGVAVRLPTSLPNSNGKRLLSLEPDESEKRQKLDGDPNLGHAGEDRKRSASPTADESAKRIKLNDGSAATPQPNIQPFECAACGDEKSVEDGPQMRCKHQYCDGCLGYLYRSTLTNEAMYPPRCCNAAFQYDEVKPRLPKEFTTSFEAKKEELDTKDRIYCCDPTCSAFISVNNRDGDVATCPKCDHETCVKCTLAAHNGECPEDESMQGVLEAAGEEGWQRCPDCKTMIDLTFGCNHMTCKCKPEFCYICGAKWKTCSCSFWYEERLIDRAQTVAERGFAGGDAEEATRQLRENYHCSHEAGYVAGNWQYLDMAHTCEDCRHRMPIYIFECRECRLRACRWCTMDPRRRRRERGGRRQRGG